MSISEGARDVQEIIRAGAKDLPPFPTALARLLKATQNEAVTAAELESILGSDTAMAVKVLRVVNSPYYGLPREIKSLNQAVIILGVRQLRNLALGLGALTALQPKNPAAMAMHEQIWQHSVEVAMAARLTSKTGGFNSNVSEEAFLLGLLHDVGRLFILATQASDLLPSNRMIDVFDDAEIESIAGAPVYEIGAALLSSWNLPNSLVEGVRNLGKPRPMESSVLAVQVAHAFMTDMLTDQSTLSSASLTPGDVADIRVRVEQERAELQSAMRAS